MSGLDTRGAWDGFREGFQLMDNYRARQEAQQNADEQIAMQQRGLNMREREMLEQRGLAERRFGLDERQLSQQQNQFDQRHALDERQMDISSKQFDRQMRADNRRFSLQERELGMRQQERNDERDMQILRAGYGKIAEGQELGDDEVETFKRYPWLSPAHVADPRMEAAVKRAGEVLDPNNPADANDPESLEAINYMFGPNVQRGDGGRKRIVGVYPGQRPGTIAFELEVIGADGKTYNAPMTKSRSSADDDEVLQVPIENLVNRVAGYKSLQGVLQSSGGRERAVALGQRLGFVNQFDDKEAPADVKTARWLVNSGAAPDVQSAWSMVRGARGKNRQDFALDYAKMISSNQDPLAESRVSSDQAFQAGLEMFDRLNGPQQQRAPASAAQQRAAPDADNEIRALGLW
ncbi:hypothetical protein WG219_10095 [Ectopseudomonas mendocina]|uniref:Phage protein n=1 Tax=Ectopseudomonas mendocina TaxID=300 RepID=A0ABZ2RMN5_ECTME